MKRALAAEAALERLANPGTVLVKVADELRTTIARAFGDGESWSTTATGALVREPADGVLPRRVALCRRDTLPSTCLAVAGLSDRTTTA
ncbi:hypothetical protein ACFRMQ_35140 [Kitasatospora sp. NPDC056783]|uniref:hypothetical protein n=1 Tax=Kitasatospora sp. NPDC056783 TaxID=3345943 RepID=UPI0036C76C5A